MSREEESVAAGAILAYAVNALILFFVLFIIINL